MSPRMTALTIHQNRVSDAWVSLAVAGEIDLATVDDLSAAIQAVLDETDANLVVDLTGTDFMDSSGLKSLIMADRSFSDQGRSLALAIGSGPISRLIDLSGVGEKMRIVDSVEGVTA